MTHAAEWLEAMLEDGDDCSLLVAADLCEEQGVDAKRLEAMLDAEPRRWNLRKLLGLAYGRAGEELLANWYRWSGEHRKCPSVWDGWTAGFAMDGSEWLWGSKNGTADDQSDGIGETFKAMLSYWQEKGMPRYPCSTRREAEMALAEYLDHAKFWGKKRKADRR